jgi:hypothetical protein
MLPVDDEALQSDVYLELLLNSHRRAPRLALQPAAQHALAEPGESAPAESPSRDLRRTAQLLDRSLNRFHPSFRFEEALAARLRAAANAYASPDVALGQALPFPPRPHGAIRPAPTPADEHDALNRVLVGGAIASGVSIAGAAAFLAWRRRSRTVA